MHNNMKDDYTCVCVCVYTDSVDWFSSVVKR